MDDRKYQLTRIRSGDYIFPSNDGATLLRVSSYLEDGSAEFSPDGKHWRKLRGTFWMARRFTGTIAEAERLIASDPDTLLDWDEWREIEYGLPTRAAAIRVALERMGVAVMRER